MAVGTLRPFITFIFHFDACKLANHTRLIPGTLPMSLFISHGAPTFALEPGLAGPALTELGKRLARPEAVLVISPHWMTREIRVGVSEKPETIHDFGGFPPELYNLEYPVSGHPELARTAQTLLEADGWNVRADATRGLDHGAWVPLMHLFPDHSAPVFQVSMPIDLDPASAWRLGQTLQPLEHEGVLIVGSGSLTHNQHEVRWGDQNASGYVREFTDWVRAKVQAGEHQQLIATFEKAPHAQRAHPTIEHFLPLIVAAGAAANHCPGTLIDGGIEHGVLAMDAFVFQQV
jgi:4,5-DOPA dioxygenase extradiol